MARTKTSKFRNNIKLRPITGVDTTCNIQTTNPYSEVVDKVADIDEKSQKYEKFVSRLETACKFSWSITGVITIIIFLILYCCTAYVNKVEQRYYSYKENVEQRLENYERRFSDLRDYCISVHDIK